MHPVFNKQHRKQRAQALTEKHPIHPPTVYVDAARYQVQDAYAVAIISHPNTLPLNSLIIRTSQPAEAKEAATALALTHSPPLPLSPQIPKRPFEITPVA